MAQDLTFAMKLINEASAELKRANDDFKLLEKQSRELDAALGITGGTAKKVGGDLDDAGDKAKKAGSDFDKAGRDAERSGGLFRGLGGAIGDVGKIAAGVTVGSGILKLIDLGLQLPGLLKGVVSGASDFNESMSKVNTVFGAENAAGMQAWAGAMSSMGASKSDAMAAVGTFGNFFSTIGVNKDEAAGMSQSLVQLASDFASFHNASPTEVMEAMGAALRGEAEPMAKYGVLMNDATLKAQALKMGLIATEKDGLSPQTKALAANALMFAQAGNAYGDFNRTSDGLANSQRIVSAEFANFKNDIGAALLPMVNQLMGKFIDFVPTLKEWGAAFTDNLSQAMPAIEGIAKALYTFSPLRLQIVALIEVIKFVGPTVQDAFVAAQPYVQQFVDFARAQLDRFKVYVDTDLKPAWENIKAGVAAVVGYIREQWPLIQPVIQAVVEIVKTHLMTMWEAISGIVKIVVDVIGGDWDGAWEHVKELVRNMVDSIVTQLGNLDSLIRALFPLIKKVLEDLGGEILKGIKAGIDHWDEVANAIWEGVQKLPGLMGNVTDWLVDVGWDLLRGIAKGIYAGGEPLVKGAIDWVAGLIPDWAKGPLGISSPSKVMDEQVGLPIAQGIAAGIMRGIPEIMLAAAGAGAAAVHGARSGAAKASGYTYSGSQSYGSDIFLDGRAPGSGSGYSIKTWTPGWSSSRPGGIPMLDGLPAYIFDDWGGPKGQSNTLFNMPDGWIPPAGSGYHHPASGARGRPFPGPLTNDMFTVGNRAKGEEEYRKAMIAAGLGNNVGATWGSHAPSLWMDDFLYQNRQASTFDEWAAVMGHGDVQYGWDNGVYKRFTQTYGGFSGGGLNYMYRQEDAGSPSGKTSVAGSGTMNGQPIQVILQIDGRTIAQIVTSAQKDLVGRA